MSLNIRWRLTLWNTLGLAVLLLVFAGLVYALLRHALYEQVDRKLLEAMEQLKQDGRAASHAEERLRYWIFEWREHENLAAVAYDGAGNVVARTEQLAAASVPPGPAFNLGEHQAKDEVIPILGRQRVLQGSLMLGDRPISLIIMASLEDVDHELGELRTVLGTAIPLVLLLSGALGYVLARKALSPMERLRRSAEEITAERLERRLPVFNPHDELGRLTATFNTTIERLQKSFAEIRRFTADASHELRTPLTAIRMEAEVALTRPLGLADHQQLLGSILEECDRLTRLTDQLLALAREDARATRQAHEPVDLSALVNDIADTMRPLAEAKGIRFHVRADPDTRILGDPARLREVFLNLLDNAIKYTPDGGEIEIRSNVQGKEAVVAVRDSGIGIPAEHQPYVFERFYRVDKARTRAEGGTGLGLSIAQSIVSSHGGKIELTSTPGKGTIFTVRVPVQPVSDGSLDGKERS
jgi:heavy metal sensor kinase